MSLPNSFKVFAEKLSRENGPKSSGKTHSVEYRLIEGGPNVRNRINGGKQVGRLQENFWTDLGGPVKKRGDLINGTDQN